MPTIEQGEQLMFISDSAISAVCATLNVFRNVNGEKGRDVATRVFSLRQSGRATELQLAIEQLPNTVQHEIHEATSGEVGIARPKPTIEWPTPQFKIAA